MATRKRKAPIKGHVLELTYGHAKSDETRTYRISLPAGLAGTFNPPTSTGEIAVYVKGIRNAMDDKKARYKSDPTGHFKALDTVHEQIVSGSYRFEVGGRGRVKDAMQIAWSLLESDGFKQSDFASCKDPLGAACKEVAKLYKGVTARQARDRIMKQAHAMAAPKGSVLKSVIG